VTTGSVWHEFEHDPRDPAYAGMRASDRDRAVVHDVLATAYAEGRLDRDELDERTAAVTEAKTYAELVPSLADLTVDAVPARFAATPSPDLRRAAEQYYRDKLRETFFEFLIPNLICWAIWFMTGHDYFPWPVFVTIPTFIHLLQVAGNKGRTIDRRVEKLQRREQRAVEEKADRPGESGPILDRQRQEPEEA
jgi:hypothetical protein